MGETNDQPLSLAPLRQGKILVYISVSLCVRCSLSIVHFSVSIVTLTMFIAHCPL